MSKVREKPSLVTQSNDVTLTMQFIIGNMEEKKGKLLLDWLKVQNSYWAWEETFDPSKLINYNRADIVFMNLGFNVGAEFGGFHFGVVIADSPKNNPVLNIIPLSSLDEGETEADLHPLDLYLGVLPGLNDKQAFAIPNQMRPISKLRIYKPRKISEKLGKLSPEQMDLIDRKILSMYTKVKLPKEPEIKP